MKSLLQDPDEVIRESAIDWAEKLQLNGYVAHVAAVHFDLRVVVARRVIKDLWLNINFQPAPVASSFPSGLGKVTLQ